MSLSTCWPCEEQRYMEIPREWEEKANRETVNAGVPDGVSV